MAKRKQKKVDVIKPKPDEQEVSIDYSFMSTVIQHAQVFGFPSILTNVIEAYRSNARKYNVEADRLEKALKGKSLLKGE